MAFNRLLGQRRHARRDLPVDRNISNPDLHGRSDQRPGFARMPIEKAFSLERGNVLHYGCLAGEAEMVLNFTRAGVIPFSRCSRWMKSRTLSLPLGQHVDIIVRSCVDRASSNEHLRVLW